MNPKPFWLHCNLCYNREAAKYKMTNCGIIICSSEKCLGAVTSRTCKDCQGPCKRVVDLDSAPEEVHQLFQPVTEQVTSLERAMAFQQYQSTELLQSHRKHLKGQKQAVDKLGAEREKIKELKEQKELDLEQMASREDYLEKKKEKLLAQKKQEEDRLRRELQVQEEQLQRKRHRQPSPPPSLSSAYFEQGFGYFQPQHGEGGAAAATTAADFFSLSDISRIEPRRARATNDQTPGLWKSPPATHSTPKREGFGKTAESGSSVFRDLEDLGRRKSSDLSEVTAAPKYSFSSKFFSRMSR